MSAAATYRPLACVMGNLDLVRPLGLAGIRCVTVAPRGHPVHFSRFVVDSIDSDGPRLVDRLLRFGRAQPARPVLSWESDDDLELIATHRVNPRFTLWAHLGACAGVNLPLLAYADNVGGPLSAAGRARGGVRWSWPRPDAKAARELGVPWWSWLGWTARSEAKTNLSLDDPMPFLRGRAWPKLALGMRSAIGRAR